MQKLQTVAKVDITAFIWMCYEWIFHTNESRCRNRIIETSKL